MLVLSRKENERLLFPSLGISVEVVRIQGNKIRLGIDAPPDVPVMREEIADLKGIEFAPDSEASDARLAAITKTIREKLQSTAGTLNRLHEHLQSDPIGQSLVLDAFRELQELEHTSNESELAEVDTHAPHALLINSNSNERELLASCLRFGGFEVAAAASVDDAFGYLSLHACPDFALIDADDATSDLIRKLRSNAGCEQMKLFGIGDPNGAGADRSFPRPINAEKLVGELTRECAGRVAV